MQFAKFPTLLPNQYQNQYNFSTNSLDYNKSFHLAQEKLDYYKNQRNFLINQTKHHSKKKKKKNIDES